jgi:threonine/homoserine/homoserine lactone efflux protein
MSEYMPQLLLAWSIQAMGVLSPGPSVMLILGVATGKGRLPAVTTAFGVACGSIVLSSATAISSAA